MGTGKIYFLATYKYGTVDDDDDEEDSSVLDVIGSKACNEYASKPCFSSTL